MQSNEKQRISRQLKRYIEQKAGSQNKASTMLGIGKSTVSVALQGDPDGKVSDEMWREIDAKTKPASGTRGWNLVATGVYNEISLVLQDAQADAGCTWIVAEAGSGKSTTARHYAETTPHAHYVLCADMVRSEFLQEVARCIGKKLTGASLRLQLMDIVHHLQSEECPILIFDEADKLTDGVFNYFVQFYNLLEDRCGLVFLSTSSIEQRMRRGLRHNKRGFAEFNSRLGRRFFRTEPVSSQDVYAVCVGNGITDEQVLASIIQDATAYDNDLRRVKKRIKAERNKRL